MIVALWACGDCQEGLIPPWSDTKGFYWPVEARELFCCWERRQGEENIDHVVGDPRPGRSPGLEHSNHGQISGSARPEQCHGRR